MSAWFGSRLHFGCREGPCFLLLPKLSLLLPCLLFNNTAATMSILEHPGLTVQIVVDGQPLPEYDDEDAVQDPTVVTKYIEAPAGSEFQIRYNYNAPLPVDKDLRVRCYIDGTLVRDLIKQKAKLFHGGVYKIKGSHEKSGKLWVRHTFCFNHLAIGELFLAMHSLLAC
jgi:hypothetical protein